MGRIRYNNSLGTLGAALTVGATSVTFASIPTHDDGTQWPTLAAGDYIPIVVEPPTNSPSANFEIIHVTAYTAGATTATIAKGQEGTNDLAHSNGASWQCTPTRSDFSGEILVFPSGDTSGAADTTAINNAIAAAGASGVVKFSPGIYTVTQITSTGPVTLQFPGTSACTLKAATAAAGPVLNLNLTANGAVTVVGGVTIDMANAAAGANAVYINHMQQGEVADVRILNGKGPGFSLINTGSSFFERCYVQDGTKGITIQGDNSGELYFTECQIAATSAGPLMTAGFEINRTTTPDIGGYYLDEVKVTCPTGTMTNSYAFNNTNVALAITPIDMDGCVGDSPTAGSPLLATKIQKLFIGGNSWFVPAVGNTHDAIDIEGCQDVRIKDSYIAAQSTYAGIKLDGAPSNLIIEGNIFDGAGALCVRLNSASAPTGLQWGANMDLTGTLTNDYVTFAASSPLDRRTPHAMITSEGAGSGQAFGIIDGANTARAKFFRMDQFNNLCMLSADFSKIIAEFADNGQMTFAGGVSPGNGSAYVAGNVIFQGSGAPAFNANPGNVYFRTDTPTIANQRIYINGGAGFGSNWVGIL